ncbi:hypothetical protein MiTa_03584 [Microcystis aeruginosa NIES-4264]|nr:hypothetical protein MiTa_03584 [Microcystis aeruginosa NIES-4264]
MNQGLDLQSFPHLPILQAYLDWVLVFVAFHPSYNHRGQEEGYIFHLARTAK